MTTYSVTREEPFPDIIQLGHYCVDLQNTEPRVSKIVNACWIEEAAYTIFGEMIYPDNKYVSSHIHDYLSYITSYKKTAHWLAPASSEDKGVALTITEFHKFSLRLRVRPNTFILTPDEFNQKYNLKDLQFMPIMNTIKRLWEKQEYYQQYVKGAKS